MSGARREEFARFWRYVDDRVSLLAFGRRVTGHRRLSVDCNCVQLPGRSSQSLSDTWGARRRSSVRDGRSSSPTLLQAAASHLCEGANHESGRRWRHWCVSPPWTRQRCNRSRGDNLGGTDHRRTPRARSIRRTNNRVETTHPGCWLLRLLRTRVGCLIPTVPVNARPNPSRA